MPPLLGIIFDLDGTLIDSAPDLRQALNAALKDYGKEPFSLTEVKSMVGDGLLTLVSRAFGARGGLPKDLSSYDCLQTFIKHYRTQKADPSQIYPFVREMLENFVKHGVKQGLCTNKQEAATFRILEELDLLRYFEFIAGGDTFTTHKPNPLHLSGVIEKLDVETAQCVMVGDSGNDVAVARAVGIPAIIVTHGYAEDYTKLNADILIDGFDKLAKALQSLGF